MKHSIRPLSELLLVFVIGFAVPAFGNGEVPNTVGTAFVGSCSVRLDSGKFHELGSFRLEIRDPLDCPHISISLRDFVPSAGEHGIYIEYQGGLGSPKILTDQSVGYNDIRLYNAQIGNHMSASLTLNGDRQVVCSGDVIKVND